MTDVVVRSLRIRGVGDRRLAAVAAHALPAALDGAFADVADGDLGTLAVVLDLDPAHYDDETLAVLWADRIRRAALSAGVRLRTATDPRPPGGDGAPTGGERRSGDAPATPDVGVAPGAAGTADVAALAARALAWLSAGGATVPVTLAPLADPVTAAAVLSRLGPHAVRALASALGRAVDGDVAYRGPGHRGAPGPDPVGSAARPPAPRPPAPGRPATRRPASPVADGLRPSDGATATLAEDAARVAAAVRALGPALDLAITTGLRGEPGLARMTRAAGLVVLYPWLADLCRTAERSNPGRDPVDVRRVAVATLADPAEPGLADDPLVGLLAGAGPGRPPAATLAPLPGAEAVVQAADDVLRRFADLLPGYGRSTAGFVRASWVLRAGLLDLDQDPVDLLAETAPLDVVLALLPYPLGLLRLPWSPTLSVRFAP